MPLIGPSLAQKLTIYTPFTKFLKICSVTFFNLAHIASLGCLLSAMKSQLKLKKGVPQAPIRTLHSEKSGNFCFAYFHILRHFRPFPEKNEKTYDVEIFDQKIFVLIFMF